MVKWWKFMMVSFESQAVKQKIYFETVAIACTFNRHVEREGDAVL